VDPALTDALSHAGSPSSPQCATSDRVTARLVPGLCRDLCLGPERTFCLLYLILLNFPTSVAAAKELSSAARLNASRVAPGCRPRLSVDRAYSVNS
jgi:hypothetical protein